MREFRWKEDKELTEIKESFRWIFLDVNSFSMLKVAGF